MILSLALRATGAARTAQAQDGSFINIDILLCTEVNEATKCYSVQLVTTVALEGSEQFMDGLLPSPKLGMTASESINFARSKGTRIFTR